MNKCMIHLQLLCAGLTAAVATGVNAQCCPSGTSGSPRLLSSNGLGESAPRAANLSTDPAWRIYEFQRDGVNYLQVNDLAGNVRVAVGRVGDTAWVMPMGTDADRVSIPLGSGAGYVVYSSDDFIIRLLRGNKRTSWIVVPISAKK